MDVDLTMHVLDKINQYDQAVLVTNDGDFAPVVSYLIGKNKLQAVLSPKSARTSCAARRRDACTTSTGCVRKSNGHKL